VSDVRHHLNAGIGLTADDGPRPQLHGVEGYRHANLALVHAMGRGQWATVDRSVPVVAKTEHSRIPRAMMARETQSPILGKVEVGVIVRLHLKCRHKKVTNPISKA
jgi:hypothetical protein